MKGAATIAPTRQLTQRESVDAVWRGRAQRLSQRPVHGGSLPDVLPVIVLGIGKERYGVYLSDVAEVLPPVRATPVPGAPPVFAGVINVHGEIRPVLDLRRLLGLPAARSGELARVILLRKDGLELGVQIDTVEQICWIGPADLRKSINADAEPSRYIQGTTNDLLMLLITEALFAELQTGVIN